jgi:hypothetical protein
MQGLSQQFKPSNTQNQEGATPRSSCCWIPKYILLDTMNGDVDDLTLDTTNADVDNLFSDLLNSTNTNAVTNPQPYQVPVVDTSLVPTKDL